MLLQVHGNSLCGAEILHRLRNLAAEFLGKGEECVNDMTGGKYDCRIIQDVYMLCTELAGGKRLNSEERIETELYTKLVGYCLVLSENARCGL